jgi:hypothetical protein
MLPAACLAGTVRASGRFLGDPAQRVAGSIIGRGGMGEAYRTRDEMGRDAALKLLPEAEASDVNWRARASTARPAPLRR